MRERRVASVRRAWLLLAAGALVVLAAAGPAAAGSPCRMEEGGIGGTGARPGAPPRPPRPDDDDGGGVGGTGSTRGGGAAGQPQAARDEDAGGIGGTGIYGVVTGFGSVCVNGLEVAYDATTPVEVDGAPADPGALSVGQVVVVEARGSGPSLRAERIAVRSAAVGPVEAVDARRGVLIVLGQRVHVGPDALLRQSAAHAPPATAGAPPRAPLAARLLSLGDVAPGSFLAVDGLRRGDGVVEATRVERVSPQQQVSVSGPLVRAPGGGWIVGALPVEPVAGTSVASHLVGRPVLVVGQLAPDGRALRAERVEAAVHFSAPVERVSLQGFVLERRGPHFRMALARVDASGAAADALAKVQAGRPVVVSGPLGSRGVVRAERVQVGMPELRDPAGDRSGAAVDERGAERSRGPERPESVEHSGAPDHPETVESAEPPERVEPVERPETPERPGEVERPEPVERPESLERPEPIERPESIERPEVVERPEPIERPEVERPEPVERPELPEHPERPDD